MSVLKFLGRDCELSTTGVAPDGDGMAPWRVTRRVLRRLGEGLRTYGAAAWTAPGGRSARSEDCLRHWTTGGQCYYSDMAHVEACTAATRFPRRFAAQSISLLLAAEAARAAAEAAAPGERLSLSAANLDMADPSISWGTHVNVAVSEELWELLVDDPRRPAVLNFVASALAAAVPFFGAGCILPRGGGRMAYSLSARAHHLGKMISWATTEPFARGLLNSRCEPHGDACQRLHLICFDFAPACSALLGSFLQCVLAAAEQGACGGQLVDPLRALRHWSWGLDARTGRLDGTEPLVDGGRTTLWAFLADLCGRLTRMWRAGAIDQRAAPEAPEMLERIAWLAVRGGRGDVAACARHLDWAAKLLYLERFRSRRGLPWGAAPVRVADHDYTHTSPARGPFWRLWERGWVDPLIRREEAEAAVAEGPADSRDWARGRLIRRYGDRVRAVDWSYVDLLPEESVWRRVRVAFPRLDSLLPRRFAPVLARVRDIDELAWAAQRLEELDSSPGELAGPAERWLRPGPSRPTGFDGAAVPAREATP